MSYGKLKLVLINHGLKGGNLPKCDFIVDCRGLPEGYIEGKTEINWTDVADLAEILTMQVIYATEPYIIEARRKERKDPYEDPFVVCCVCAWGMNRSMLGKRLIYETISEYWSELFESVEMQ